MDRETSIRTLEEQLTQLRERVESTRADLDGEVRRAIRLVEDLAEKSRNVANEALSEIRHLDQQLRELAERD